MKRFQRILAGGLTAALLAGLLVTGASAAGFTRGRTYAQGQFTDVRADAWYAESVKDAYEFGLMNGTGAATFNPNGFFTVAEAATIAARMHNLYNGGSGAIPTASGAWYQGSVNYCIQNGIFYKDTFESYTANATRAEMAGIMAAALPDSAWKAINQVEELPDVVNTMSYGMEIFRLYNAGVFTGSDKYGTFQPNDCITRAEVAAIVARMADPGLRKTLSLTPVSEREWPELPAEVSKVGDLMNNSRLRYQDGNTGLWGYLNSKAQKVIPAQYSSAGNFRNGYAIVENKDGKRGLIDTSGSTVLPVVYGNISYTGYSGVFIVTTTDGLKHLAVGGSVRPGTYQDLDEVKTDFGYGSSYAAGAISDGINGNYYFKATQGDRNYGVIDQNGKVLVPVLYKEVSCNGVYFLASTGSATDIYDLNGKKLNTFDEVDAAWNNPLLVVKEDGKYALATAGGRITEAIYSGFDLPSNSVLAKLSLRKMDGSVDVLAGENGVICESDNGILDSTLRIQDGNYVSCSSPSDDGYRLLDVNGGVVLSGLKSRIEAVKGDYVICHDGTIYTLDGVCLNDSYPSVYVIGDGKLVAGYDLGDWYQDLNGKYGVCDSSGRVVTHAVYDSENEAYAAARGMGVASQNSWIVNSVVYLSKADAVRAKVEYKDGMPFDFVSGLGEDCYIGSWGEIRCLVVYPWST